VVVLVAVEGQAPLPKGMGLKRYGWDIGVPSWQNSGHAVLKEWAKANGSFIALDNYCTCIAFIEGLRDAKKFARRFNPTIRTYTQRSPQSQRLRAAPIPATHPPRPYPPTLPPILCYRQQRMGASAHT